MAGPYKFPGVYVEEIPGGAPTIPGISTSNTAFVDFFPRGPENEAVQVNGFTDFERVFGGLDTRSEASYAIQQYFLNGGSTAWVVRVTAGAGTAQRSLPHASGGSGSLGASGSGASGLGASGLGASGLGASGAAAGSGVLVVKAASSGEWGNRLQVGIDYQTRNSAREFNLVVREAEVDSKGRVQVFRTETYRNLSTDKSSSRYAEEVVNTASSLIRLDASNVHGGLPATTEDKAGDDIKRPASVPASFTLDVIGAPRDQDFVWIGRESKLGPDVFSKGWDGVLPDAPEWKTSKGAPAILGDPEKMTGLYALERIAPEIFNLLCIPAVANLEDEDRLKVIGDAQAYCERKRAFMLVDVPADLDDQPDGPAKLTRMRAWLSTLEDQGLRHPNSAVYFPRLKIPDPLNENRARTVPASGTMAGIYARTDASLGVWVSPAGTHASLRGASLDFKMNDDENGRLNPFGVNALRSFPVFGGVCWGARTLVGADLEASEWKYLAVRRMALYIEEALYQGLKWAVFRPNDEPLWAQIRLSVGAFMHNLFRQGAFQGRSPREAYFVKCDQETTSSYEMSLGIVNILVGFKPVFPAEFVVIKVQQIVNQDVA